MANDELKLCQCGSAAVHGFATEENPNFPKVKVFCEECPNKTWFYETKELATDAWNHRPLEDKLREELMDAEEILGENAKEIAALKEENETHRKLHLDSWEIISDAEEYLHVYAYEKDEKHDGKIAQRMLIHRHIFLCETAPQPPKESEDG